MKVTLNDGSIIYLPRTERIFFGNGRMMFHDHNNAFHSIKVDQIHSIGPDFGGN